MHRLWSRWRQDTSKAAEPRAKLSRRGLRRTLHTGAGLLTDKQKDRLHALFNDDQHVEVEATWGIYQRMIAAYRDEDRRRGREHRSPARRGEHI